MATYYQMLSVETDYSHGLPQFVLQVCQMNNHRASCVHNHNKESRQVHLALPQRQQEWQLEEEQHLEKPAEVY